MMGLASPFALRRLGILGMNRRNISFIGDYNPRKNFRFTDNKLETKSAALKLGIPVPELYGTITHQFEIKHLTKQLASLDSFVIKPTQGSGGKGILVITKRSGELFVKSSGVEVDSRDIKHHTSNILAGLHSLGGRNDSAMIEALIDFDPVLRDYSFEGVPDIRVIIFRGVPVMAMMRCATRVSDGKANLHQGAVGVGLDIGTGQSICAIQHNQVVGVHPDTGVVFSALAIPYWEQILQLSASCANMTGLDYIGADIVLDRIHGPMLLEVNARPGLAIQIANKAGLRERLAEADRIADTTGNQDEKIRLARAKFTQPVASDGK